MIEHYNITRKVPLVTYADHQLRKDVDYQTLWR